MSPELWIRMIAAMKQWNAERQKRSVASKKGWAKPGARKNASNAGIKRWGEASEEERKRWTDATSDAAKRPEVRATLVEVQRILSADPDVRANKSKGRKKWLRTKDGQKFRERAKKRKTAEWADPEKVAKMKALMQVGNQRPEATAKRSEAAKKAADRFPGLKKSRSDAVTKSWKDLSPEEKKERLAPMLGASRHPDVRKKIGEAHKAKFADPIKGPQLRAKMKEVADRPEVQKAIAAGQRKGAAAILNRSRHSEKPKIVDRAMSFLAKKERAGEKPSHAQVYLAADPKGSKNMTGKELRAAGKALAVKIDYWKKKEAENRFSVPLGTFPLNEASQETRESR